MKKKSLLLLFILTLIITSNKVKAVELNYNLVGLEDAQDNVLLFKPNEKKEISIVGDEKYIIANCSSLHNDNVNIEYDNKKCVIEPKGYLKTDIIIEIKEANNDNIIDVKRFDIDTGFNDYFKFIIDNLNGKYTKNELKNLLPDNIVIDNINYNSGQKNGYKTEFKYCYHKTNFYDPICDKLIKTIKYKYENKLNVNVNSIQKISLYQIPNANYKDYIFISDDEKIAIVNQNGSVFGVSPGKTYIKVYNKKNMDYDLIEVNVSDSDFTNLTRIKSKLDNSQIEIDINHTNNVYNKNIDKDFKSLILNYIINKSNMSNDDLVIEEFTNNNGKYSFILKENMLNEKVKIENLSVSLNGIYAEYSITNSNSKRILDLNIVNYTKNNLNIEVDNNILKKIENNKYEILHSGITDIKINSNNFNEIISVYIEPTNKERDDFNLFIKNMNVINIPYCKEIKSLNLLETIINTKILEKYNDEIFKKYLNVNTRCRNKNECFSYINVVQDDKYILGDNYNKYINVTYGNKDDIKEIDLTNIYNSILESYFINNNDTILCLSKSKTKEEFIKNIISKTNLNSINVPNYLKIDIKPISEYNIKNNIPGGIEFVYNIYYKNDKILSKKFKINISFVIDCDSSFDFSKRLSYLKDYIDNLLNVNSVVTNIKDNVYQVNANGRKFNVILDYKEMNLVTFFNVSDNYIKLNKAANYKLNISYTPKEANYFDFIYKSDDEKIAKVDNMGNITGVNKGYTIITIEEKYGGCNKKIFVSVDLTEKEFMNEILKTFKKDYIIKSNVLNSEKNDLKSYLEFRIIDDNNRDNFPLYSLNDKFEFKVIEENGKYKMKYEYKDYPNPNILSDYFDINYQFKGISVDKFKYDLKTNDKVNINLSFSEGDNNNLLISYSNPNIVKLEKDGTLTALSTGITNVYITDKYDIYSIYITVEVDYDKYIDIATKKLQNTIYDINLNDITSEYQIDYIIEGKLNDDFGLGYDLNEFTNCNFDNDTCTYTDNNRNKNINFKIKKHGIYIPRGNLESYSLNEEFTINYKEYNLIEKTNIVSKTPDICIVNNNKIKGIKPGKCKLNVVSGSYNTSEEVIIGKEELYEESNKIIDIIDNTINLPVLGLNRDNVSIEYPFSYLFSLLKSSTFDNLIQKKYNFKDYMSMPFYQEINSDKAEVAISSFNKITSKSKIVNINYTKIPIEYVELGKKIAKEIPINYDLNLGQYILYQESIKKGENKRVTYFSDFRKNLEKICSDCTLIPSFAGGSDPYYESFAIMKDEYPIAHLQLAFNLNFPYIPNFYNLTEEEQINLMKKLIIDAYKEVYGSKPLKTNSNIYNRIVVSPIGYTLNNIEEPKVEIKKKFSSIPEEMKYVYEITINDYTFETKLSVPKDDEIKYTYSITDVKIDKESLEIKEGETSNITYTIYPTLATNKKLNFISSDKNIVEVNDSGQIIAKGIGKAKIEINTTDGSNIKKIINITVKENKDLVKVKIGDVNCDNYINMTDLIMLRKNMAGLINLNKSSSINADINKDKKINMTDIIKLRKHLAGLEEIK